MELEFTKMHGLGNDFVVLNGIDRQLPLDPVTLRRLSDRHLGVGCDQVLVVEAASGSAADFGYRIFNADGNEVEQCGNGARCFARYVQAQGLTTKNDITVETRAGLMTLHVLENGQVTVNMGVPCFEPREIPFDAPARQPTYALDVGRESAALSVLSLGNPHAVMRIEDMDMAPVTTLGPLIERHPRFPKGVNAGFMELVARDRLRVRVWERGVGETMACGSGACAAVVAGRIQGLLDETVTAQLTGGELVISWQGEGESVLMTGPAQTVYEGRIRL